MGDARGHVARRRAVARAGHVRAHPERRARAANWLSYSGTVIEPALQPARSDHGREREGPEAAVGLAGALAREVRGDRARRRRRALHRPGAERRRRARRRDRPHLLDVRLRAVAGRAHVLRPREPRARDPRRHAVHGHDRRAPARDRREERQARLERDGRELGAALLDHDVARRREGQGDRSARPAATSASAASSRRSTRRPARKSGASTRSPAPGEPGNETWAGDSWKDRRRGGLERGRVRPARRTSCSSAPAIRRPTGTAAAALGDNLYSDSVVALDADTGKLEVALPVHAARRDRLRLDAGAGARRHRVARRAAQGDALGESQRPDVRARSRHGQVPARQAVRQGELDGRLRRERPSAARPAAQPSPKEAR